MEGVTTAIVGFIFLGAAFPAFIKNRTHYYLAIMSVIVVLFFDLISMIFHGSEEFSNFCRVIEAVAVLAAFIMVVLSAGGLSIKQFGSELGNAFEVVRRGESEKEVIIPLSDAARKIKADAEMNRSSPRRPAGGEAPPVYHLDDPAPSAPPPQPDRGPLPLD